MSDIMPSPDELMRQHELAALRDERDAALEENKRLRELYENVVVNRKRFGWTINHLLECEEALRVVEAHAAELQDERDALISESIEHASDAAEVRAATLREVEALLRSDDTVRRIGRASAECVALLVERRLSPEAGARP